MSKTAKKGKKEDEAKLAEERTAFEGRLVVERQTMCLDGCPYQSDWLNFLTPDNVEQLAAQTPGSPLTVSLLLFVRLYEAGLTPNITQNEFKLASFLADSLFGYSQELKVGAQETSFAVNFFLNRVLGFVPPHWQTKVQERAASLSPEVAFENWREGKFTFTKEKLDQGHYAPLFGPEEESEGVWATIGPLSINPSAWNDPGLRKKYREEVERFETHSNIKLAHDFSADLGRLFTDSTEVFRFFLEQPMEEQVTEEIKAVERPKIFVDDIHDEEPLRPLQAIHALQNSKTVATPRGLPRAMMAQPTTDHPDANAGEALDSEALQLIRDEVAKVRERLQAELDAKIAEAATTKKGKK